MCKSKNQKTDKCHERLLCFIVESKNLTFDDIKIFTVIVWNRTMTYILIFCISLMFYLRKIICLTAVLLAFFFQS